MRVRLGRKATHVGRFRLRKGRLLSSSGIGH